MLADQSLAELYPCLNEYTAPVKKAERVIVGREKEMASMKAALLRPELCNVMLLGEAGSGKTAVVQGLMLNDEARVYLEVDLSKMIANCKTDVNEMATKLKTLFDETAEYCKKENVEIVLFIDEFHQVVQLSDAAVEALKPLLADSGTRGIRVIAATTYTEFRKFIAPNQPLVERLQRINMEPPSKEVTIEILRGMAERYGVDGQFYNDSVYEMIYDYTERYIPANSQPRKSLLILDAMIGWHKATDRPMNQQLLADVIYESEGVNVAFRVDATAIKKELDKKVLAQQFATKTLQERLQICVADLNDKSKPMSTFLFTGSSGTGKMLDNNVLVPVYVPGGRGPWFKRNGDLKTGDMVFNRKGKPVRVLGVFPQGMQDVYVVTLRDGRQLRCGAGHIWTYRSRAGNGSRAWRTATTAELMGKNMFTRNKEMQFVIPMNEAVNWPRREQSVDPYIVGSFLSCGVYHYPVFGLATDNPFVIDKCARILRSSSVSRDDSMGAVLYSNNQGPMACHDVFRDHPEFLTIEHADLMIPEEYMHAAIEQRWRLVQGLFDSGGSIKSNSVVPYQVSYSTWSKKLAEDVQSLLFSLGIGTSVREVQYKPRRNRWSSVKYIVRIQCSDSLKPKFFLEPEKQAIAKESITGNNTTRKRTYETVGIWSVDKLPERVRMTCIEVEDDEKLYQAGQFVVTHNTETVKQLARILFENENHLIRMDMTEYANSDSLERFRHELTSKVWAQPYSIVLLDEVEKACAPVTRILLQVLDDGRLSDENNREVSFTNCYIIMTTNAGSEIYKNIAQYGVDDTGSGAQMARYDKLIRSSIMATTGDNKFPPELLGRIDCIVPFQPLSENTMKAIVRMKLMKLKEEVSSKHGIRLKINPKVIDYLVEENLDTDSDSGGARAVMSKLESEVTTAVAQFINSHPYSRAMAVMVEGELATRNVHKLLSDARVVVKEVQ